jgi:sigma-E factor negative regulatory protein RseB
MRRARLALLGALCFAAPAFAQDAAGWMTRMGEALTGLDYHGDLIYAYGGQIETLRVFHASGPDGGRERLVSVSGAAREIVRAGGQVTCVGTAAQPASYGDPANTPRLLGVLPGGDAQNLQVHYAFVLGSTERVATLPAQVLDIRPRDAYRYGFRLWLERETGMLLKSMRFGADGRPVEQLMFTRIALGERPAEADLALSEAGQAVATSMQLPRADTGRTPAWHAIDPPPGFVLALQQPAPQGGSEHLIYSDGIASVSIYVEPLTPETPAFSGPASRGAINLHGRVLDGHQITVLGDVPPPTVERFAQGIAPATGG